MTRMSTLVGLLSLSLSASVVTARADGTVMKRIYWAPVHPKASGQVADLPGNIHIVYGNGKDVLVSRKGTAADNAEHPFHLSPDGTTGGWLEGEYQTAHYFAATKLVLYRGGRVLCRTTGQLAFIEDWFFWNGGKQVALRSRLGHGPAVDELHDTVSGRLLARIDGFKSSEPGAPAWARRLGG